MKVIDTAKSSVIILSAGLSNRMGVSKFQLIGNDGSTFLETIIKKYLAIGCSEIVVVANPKNVESIRAISRLFSAKIIIAINHDEASNRLQSVIVGAGLLSLNYPVFIQPVDTPFFQIKSLQILIENSKGSAFVVPVNQSRGGHPVIVSSKILSRLPAMQNSVETLRDFLKKFNGKRVEVTDKMILANINTPEEYRKALSDAQ